jgi:hypothetical protein
MITQECSCYWIDAAELLERFSNLKSSNTYYLEFSNPTTSIKSGLIGISIPGSEFPASTKSTIPAATVTTSKVVTDTPRITAPVSDSKTVVYGIRDWKGVVSLIVPLVAAFYFQNR